MDDTPLYDLGIPVNDWLRTPRSVQRVFESLYNTLEESEITDCTHPSMTTKRWSQSLKSVKQIEDRKAIAGQLGCALSILVTAGTAFALRATIDWRGLWYVSGCGAALAILMVLWIAYTAVRYSVWHEHGWMVLNPQNDLHELRFECWICDSCQKRVKYTVRHAYDDALMLTMFHSFNTRHFAQWITDRHPGNLLYIGSQSRNVRKDADIPHLANRYIWKGDIYLKSDLPGIVEDFSETLSTTD